MSLSRNPEKNTNTWLFGAQSIYVISSAGPFSCSFTDLYFLQLFFVHSKNSLSRQSALSSTCPELQQTNTMMLQHGQPHHPRLYTLRHPWHGLFPPTHHRVTIQWLSSLGLKASLILVRHERATLTTQQYKPISKPRWRSFRKPTKSIHTALFSYVSHL